VKTSQIMTDGALAKKLQPEAPQVIVIDPTIQVKSGKLRTAAYARVSSDSDDQLNSFTAQVDITPRSSGKTRIGSWWTSTLTRASPDCGWISGTISNACSVTAVRGKSTAS
jgi:hypothetical protein